MHSLTVYLGSGGRARDIFKEQTAELGRIIGENNLNLVYGGMDAGLMGLLAKTAQQSGAPVTGIIPEKLKDSERLLGGLSETIFVDELCERKKLLFEKGDAIVVLPGGFGTLDETLEVLYWQSLGLHDKPLILVNVEGYWDCLIRYLNTLPDFHADSCIAVDQVSDILPALEKSALTNTIKPPPHLPHFEDEIVRDTNQPIIIDKATVENSYFGICALGLKQLSKHKRHIGFLNDEGQFDPLLEWINAAHKEHFITEHCIDLFDSAADAETLKDKLDHQEDLEIDLHGAKWGEAIHTPSV